MTVSHFNANSPNMPAPLSIIIPTLNAEDHLPGCLNALVPALEANLLREVIVADGGSNDATLRLAEGSGAKFISSEQGRAKQMIAGALAARGDWLLFLHADTWLSRDWVERTRAHIDQNPDKAATFMLAFRTDDHMGKVVARRANWRSRTFGLPYGDQGLLISRRLYTEIGGFPDVPLMEDLKLVRVLGKSRISFLSAEARTGAEKYEKDGWRRRSLRNIWLQARYLCGADPEKLARAYK